MSQTDSPMTLTSKKPALCIVGLGRMGANMARRLARAGFDLVLHDADAQVAKDLAGEINARAASDINDVARMLAPPRMVWMMVPHGRITDSVLDALLGQLDRDDIIIDGGNSHYKETMARAVRCADHGVHLLDVGTSGGVFGLERGYCLMVGGDEQSARALTPVFSALAPGLAAAERTPSRQDADDVASAEEGWLYCGPSGAGHFAKMIHNGIEYGMMQAFAEGFALLRAASSNSAFDFNIRDLAETWRRGSVVSSWILDLTADALAEPSGLAPYSAEVQDSGEGRWTVEAAVDYAVPAPVLTAALYSRFRSRQSDPTAEKILSAMRFKFGGHTAPASDTP